MKSLKVGSRFQFTRKIELNDEYLRQYFPERKVLWMTSDNFLRSSLSSLLIFDCMGAIFRKLCATFAICATFGPIWVRNGHSLFLCGHYT